MIFLSRTKIIIIIIVVVVLGYNFVLDKGYTFMSVFLRLPVFSANYVCLCVYYTVKYVIFYLRMDENRV